MDFADPKQRAVFLEVHSGLPREAPGSRASTARALAAVGELRAHPNVLDVGCGPGAQTMDLASLLPKATITAVDAHPPFLAAVEHRADVEGVAQRVRVVHADMRALPFPNASFDLVWSEGAAYIMGFEAALAAWRPLLVRGGSIALTELVWLRDNAPEDVRRLWCDAYPAMTDTETCRRIVRSAGCELKADFVLPEPDWLEDYYRPMELRLDRMDQAYASDPVAQRVLQDCRDEIAAYRRYSAWYGYAFFVMRVR